MFLWILIDHLCGRLERSLTQTLRQQQDEAYEVSLRADQEKERLRLVELERQRAEQQAVDDELQAEQDRKAVSDDGFVVQSGNREQWLCLFFRLQEIARQKIELASSVPNEPEASTPGSIIVLFKLPSGQRVERRFMSSDSLKVSAASTFRRYIWTMYRIYSNLLYLRSFYIDFEMRSRFNYYSN